MELFLVAAIYMAGFYTHAWLTAKRDRRQRRNIVVSAAPAVICNYRSPEDAARNAGC